MERSRDSRKRSCGPWADLVISVLSVNRYSLEKTFKLFDGLEEEGLFDPKILAAEKPEELARRLVSAGYSRGPTMTGIFTDRLASLGSLAARAPLGQCSEVLKNGTRDEVSSLLKGVKGIGPVVLQNFFFLRGDG